MFKRPEVGGRRPGGKAVFVPPVRFPRRATGLASGESRATVPFVKSLVESAGRWVAALWLGAALWLTMGAGPALFSREVIDAVGRRHAGVVAQALLHRYFLAQTGAAAAVFLAALLGGRSGFRRPRLARPVGAGLLLLALAASGWLEPKLRALNAVRYSETASDAERAQAGGEFGRWHGVSQVGNLLIIGLLILHAVPRAPGREVPGGPPRAASP